MQLPETETPLLDALGGSAGCRRLSEAFYARVDRDPLLRPLFPGKSLHCAISELTAYLVQLLGGPADQTQFRWWVSLRESHLRVRVGAQERDAWLRNMRAALDDASIPETARDALSDLFAISSAYLMNVGEPATSDETPRRDGRCRDADVRWRRQLATDEAVAAIRRGDAAGAIRIAEESRLETESRALFLGLLGVMISSGSHSLVAYATERVQSDTRFVAERYAGRTLLHAAAARGEFELVRVLLQLGADPNALDGGSHTPLYSAANECAGAGGAEVVRALVQAGADVNACDGVKRCTPLHMAARRGHAAVLGALLEVGADLEAQDNSGDTPLRRAVNCGQAEAAALLLSKGADPQSIGSRGLTPPQAARSEAMKQLFGSYSI